MNFLSDWFLPCVRAFLVGGALCVVAQILLDKTKLTPARILVLYVVSGVALTAVGLYQPLVDFAGAGATVPLTGFGFLVAKGTRLAVSRHGLLGILSGPLSAASAGITASLALAFLAALIFKGNQKK